MEMKVTKMIPRKEKKMIYMKKRWWNEKKKNETI